MGVKHRTQQYGCKREGTGCPAGFLKVRGTKQVKSHREGNVVELLGAYSVDRKKKI